MKKYIASVKDGDQLKIITSEYSNKKDFARDLRRNGYKVQFIGTDKTFGDECEKYYAKLIKTHQNEY